MSIEQQEKIKPKTTTRNELDCLNKECISSRGFVAEDYLGTEGKKFLKERTSSMPDDLWSINYAINSGLNKGWISKQDIQKYKQILGDVKNAFDTYSLKNSVLSEVKDPVLKNPKSVILHSAEEIVQLRKYMTQLSEKLDMREGAFYVLNDEGRSIIFLDEKINQVSSAHSKQELVQILLAASDSNLISYFSRLFDLPKATVNDIEEVKVLKTKIQRERAIIQYLKSLPFSPELPQPNLTGKKVKGVMQGNANGRFVTAENVDFIGTEGMGPCVALVIYQAGKALIMHIDNFSGEASLGGRGAARELNLHMWKFEKNESLQVHIIGNSDGSGRQNLLDIFTWLEHEGIKSSIRTVNFSNHGRADSVLLDIKNGAVYPGARLQ